MKARFFALFVLAAAALPLCADEVQDGVREQVEAIIEDFNQKNYDSAIARIEAMKPEGADAAFLLNLKGAAFTKKKDYAEAEKAFNQAIALSPGLFAAHFNLGEIQFLQGHYDQALKKFQAMLDADPRNELLQFKVFLSQLNLGDESAAKRTLSRIKYPGETPAWYYAQAAWEHSKGNKAKVSDYLAAARYLFQGKTELFDETLADLGIPRR